MTSAHKQQCCVFLLSGHRTSASGIAGGPALPLLHRKMHGQPQAVCYFERVVSGDREKPG